MRGRSILSLEDLSREEIETLLDIADRFGRDGIPPARAGRVVCGLFFNPSLRTRTSLEVAAAALGAQCVTHDVGRGVWDLEVRDGAVMDGDKPEHVRDAVGKFLSGVVDLLGVRCFGDFARPWDEVRGEATLQAIVRCSGVPVVNLESALFHPMQSLADLLVLRRHLKGERAGHTVAVTWANHPKPTPMAVTNSALLAFSAAGYRVRLVHPPGFELDPEIVARARELAGERLTLHLDMDEGLRGASVIYAKEWGAIPAYGNPAGDRELRARHRDWIVDERRQSLGAPGAFMHCLPVRRNVVVTDGVIDGPNSWVAEQSRSRVLVQAAVLHELL
jgi:N-acetylornithine carbamoyltransferase